MKASRYKLFIYPRKVTLVDTETGRRESFATNGLLDLRAGMAIVQCRNAGIDLKIEHVK